MHSVISKDWRKWWNEDPVRARQSDLYYQVGRTVGGIPTGEPDLVATSDAILAALRLSRTETVLDLCCGNGLISAKIAPHCGFLVGVDFSEPLIQTARDRTPNIKFVVSDVTILDGAILGVDQIDAAYLAFAFQYFDEAMARKLLKRLKILASPAFRLLLESIPDIDRIAAHYHTPERMAAHQKRKAEGTEEIENWWSAKQLAELAGSEGFACAPLLQHRERVSSHYRFDALLTLIA